MNKKLSFFIIVAVMLVLVHLAEAQQTGKIFRIGFLDNSTAPVEVLARANKVIK